MHPLWMRWLAAACLLLVSVASTAQAVHIHGQWLPHGKAQVHAPVEATSTPGGDVHCSLCVAMHSALPGTVVVAPAPSPLSALPLAELQTSRPDARWPFAMFSRPPPVRS